ncbi:hypothetical protein ACIQU6_34920 [Streptomyces sp. NPDC090442]|uniref:hypothetical protein n=1 Tax=Streptomyces sp. NPDC090442 TaxID=3365962 RepID=UPI0037F71792
MVEHLGDGEQASTVTLPSGDALRQLAGGQLVLPVPGLLLLRRALFLAIAEHRLVNNWGVRRLGLVLMLLAAAVVLLVLAAAGDGGVNSVPAFGHVQPVGDVRGLPVDGAVAAVAGVLQLVSEVQGVGLGAEASLVGHDRAGPDVVHVPLAIAVPSDQEVPAVGELGSPGEVHARRR